MVVLKWFVLFLIAGAVLGFALQNQDQTVTIKLAWYQTPQIPLFLAIYFAFLAGVLLYFLVSLSYHIKIRSELARFRREYQRVHDELNHLRNLNLDKEIEGFYKNQPSFLQKPIAESKPKSSTNEEFGWGA